MCKLNNFLRYIVEPCEKRIYQKKLQKKSFENSFQYIQTQIKTFLVSRPPKKTFLKPFFFGKMMRWTIFS